MECPFCLSMKTHSTSVPTLISMWNSLTCVVEVPESPRSESNDHLAKPLSDQPLPSAIVIVPIFCTSAQEKKKSKANKSDRTSLHNHDVNHLLISYQVYTHNRHTTIKLRLCKCIDHCTQKITYKTWYNQMSLTLDYLLVMISVLLKSVNNISLGVGIYPNFIKFVLQI